MDLPTSTVTWQARNHKNKGSRGRVVELKKFYNSIRKNDDGMSRRPVFLFINPKTPIFNRRIMSSLNQLHFWEFLQTDRFFLLVQMIPSQGKHVSMEYEKQLPSFFFYNQFLLELTQIYGWVSMAVKIVCQRLCALSCISSCQFYYILLISRSRPTFLSSVPLTSKELLSKKCDIYWNPALPTHSIPARPHICWRSLIRASSKALDSV